MKRYKNGLIIMRAQPFHAGHQLLIRRMLAECEKGIVLLGSVQECRTRRNPFTFEERKEMINNVFDGKITPGRLEIGGLEDINDYDRWATYVLTKVGYIPEVYYCGTAYDGELFAAKGINTQIMDRKKMFAEEVSATRIREALEAGNPEWTKYIDPKNQVLIQQKDLY